LKPGSGHPASISLALQGGGAHGAFTWGVLDALLEQGELSFDGISGTSAGAMNAVVLAHGLLAGGRDGAREALQAFWHAVSGNSPFDLYRAAPPGSRSTAARLAQRWTRHLSPLQLNPFDINPLRDILAAQVDFERLRTASPVSLFVAATHANTGRLRLFRTHELGLDALLASACLPMLHHPIEIDGEPYWDGAWSANPAVFPLFYDCAARDILLVLLSPRVHGPTPRTAEEIRARSQEIAFNAAFLREMQAFAEARTQAGRLARDAQAPSPADGQGGPLEQRLLATRFHLIDAQSATDGLDAATRLQVTRGFLEGLRDLGRTQALAWLASHRADIGQRATVDIGTMFG
jgi:NTE family protein